MHLAEESLLRGLIMGRRLDFDKAFRNEQARYGLSVKDEAEWMENDAAARWLAKNANRASQKADYRPSAERRTSCDMKIRRRKSLKRRHADLDPCDPHDQLAGVDMKQLPWK
jgi:hypothetical protein